MNISKADILNPDSSDPSDSTNPAVKLALAETHVISETKSYLESQGVVLSAFNSRARSDTTILVKNIPYGTDAEAIRGMFAEHGELKRVIVPPAGTMAVVEFVHSDDCARGFRAVAYRRLGNSIIYLEKGPLGIFDGEPEVDGQQSTVVASAVKPVAIADDQQAGSAARGDYGDAASPSGATLFVKNLAFATTTDKLDATFRHLPGFAFARVQTKPDPARPDGQSTLSMGYGFVGFKSTEEAKRGMRSMHGFVLDGHALVVKFAARGTETESKKDQKGSASKGRTTKMLVKNVPFEATKKDIRELFRSVLASFTTLCVTC
jgi:multiple RNA-binding domain-containing protein 1